MSTTISVRLPEKIINELNRLSKVTERPQTYFIQKALEHYLQEQSDLQLAMDRLQDADDPVISMSEMREEVGI